MKWDGKAFESAIKKRLYGIFEYDIPKLSQMDNKEFADYLRKRHRNSGSWAGDKEIPDFSANNEHVQLIFAHRILNNLGENTIELTWNMTARYLRAWENEKKSKAEDQQINPIQPKFSNHYCGSPYGEHCNHLVYSSKDTVLDGKKLDNFCIYCTSENKIRKIGSMSSWTGLTPKFCPVRRAAETETAENELQQEDKQMAKKRSFDTAILNDIKSVAGDSFADNIKMLPVDQLHDNPENFYDLSDLDTLVEDIDRQGLKTPLYVVPDDDNGYMVISGHRRKAAVQELINSGKYGTDKLPCYIGVKKSESETMLDLIMLNATTRVISDAETVKQCEKLEEVFKQLEADGKKVHGRMRDKIAAALNVSPAQVGKVENIRHNAIDEVKAAVDEGKMSISTANELSKLEPEKQKDLIERKKPEEITHKEVKEVQKKEPPEKAVPYSAPKAEPDEETTEDTSFADEKTEDNSYPDDELEMQQHLFDYETDEPSEEELAQKKEAVALLLKPKEYFDEIINSGMCNSIISGYILLALDELDVQLTDAQRGNFNHIINRMFDFTDAQQARKRYNSI